MKRVWLPYYTCDALLEPFEYAGIPYHFYALAANLALADAPVALPSDEYLVYINYFGLKNEYVQELVGRYGDQLLVDNTQNFFAHGYARGWSFNSARKSFGVPDGGYLYGPTGHLGTADDYLENTEYQVQYLVDRLRGAQQQAYAGFVAYEQTLTSNLTRISAFSAALLSQVDYAAAARARCENFARYHAALAPHNTLALDWQATQADAATVPFCYPFLPAIEVARQILFERNIFVPWLWPDTLSRNVDGHDWERNLTQRLLPLPLDQRYGAEEVDFVIQHIKRML